MKDAFGEFYRPSEDDVRRFVTGATVVVDANVLLELYRLGTSERAQVLDVLDKVKDRLWLPYQAGLEYQRGRLGVVAAQARNYERTQYVHGVRSVEQMGDNLASLSLPEEVRTKVQSLLPDLADKLRLAVEEYEANIEELAKQHVVTVAQARSADPVRERLDDLLDGRVGQKPDQKTYAERIKEGLRRSDAQIPPGYKDSGKEGDDRKAGDYLVWVQILEYAETSDRPLLFVTKDQKEDWFERFAGEMIGPRTELVAEFATRSDQGYHQVTLARFLALANEFLSTEVDGATIKRVSETSEIVTQEAWRGLREAGQIKFPPETLRALREAGQIKFPPETLRALREAGRIQFPPETLRAIRDVRRLAEGFGDVDEDPASDEEPSADDDLDEPK